MGNRLLESIVALRDKLPLDEAFAEFRVVLEECLANAGVAGGVTDDLATLATSLGAGAQGREETIWSQASALHERVQSLDDALATVVMQMSSGYQSGRKVQLLLERQIQDLESRVRTSSDIESIRQLVLQRLAVMGAQTDNQRAKDATHFTALLAQLSGLNATLCSFEQQLTTLRAHAAHYGDLAEIDPATDLPNWSAFAQRVAEECARFRRYRVAFGVMEVSVDNLEEVVARYQEVVGNRAMRIVARLLRESLREPDYVARLDGFCFGVLLPHTDEAALAALRQDIRLRVNRAKFHYARAPVELVVSLGATTVRDGDDPSTLRTRARAARSRACVDGGHGSIVY